MEESKSQVSDHQPGDIKDNSYNRQFNFFGIEQEPSSLIMLKPLKKMAQLFYNLNATIMIHDTDEFYYKFKSIFDKHSDAEYVYSPNVDHALNLINNEFKQRKITIFTSKRMINSTKQKIKQKVCELPCVQVIICFKMNILHFQQLHKGKPSKFRKLVQNTADVKKYVINQEPKTRKMLEHLPNMIAINQNGMDSSIQLIIMIAMINQKCHKKLMIREFCKLTKKIYPKQQEENIQQFEKIMLQDDSLQETIKKTLKSYTLETSFYKVLNKLLKSSIDCTELFYCQFYFQQLFKAIKHIYEQQKDKKYKDFVCYRGAKASPKEIEYYKNNVGNIIQMMGFFSTSMDRSVGERFVDNILMKIRVKDVPRDSRLDFGYADLRQYSQRPNEQQVLFNPLNTYKIVSVSEIQMERDLKFGDGVIPFVHFIELEYGQLSRLMTLKKRRPEEQAFYDQAQFLMENMFDRVKSQGFVFSRIEGKESLNGLKYWNEYLNYAQKQKEIMGLKLGNGNQLEQRSEYLQKQKNIIEAKFEIGKIYEMNTNYCEALQKFEIIKAQIDDENNLSYFMANQSIGTMLTYMGQHEKATNIFTYGLGLIDKIYEGNENLKKIQKIRALNNIGLLMYNMEHYSEAHKKYKQSLQIADKTIGPQHPIYLTIQNNIAMIMLKMGEFQKTLTVLNETLSGRGKVLGSNHPEYSITRSNIALVYYHMGLYKQSLAQFNEALKAIEKLFGLSHTSCLAIKSNIAMVLSSMGLYKQAYAQESQCLIQQNKLLGQNHPSSLKTKTNMATSLIEMGRYQQALVIYEQCLAIQEKISGLNHPSYIQTKGNLGVALQYLGRYQEALAKFYQCLQAYELTFSLNHPSCFIQKGRIASCLFNMGRYEQSIVQYRECLEYFEKHITSQNNIYYLRIKSHYALALSKTGSHQQALDLMKECLNNYQQKFGKNSHSYFKSQSNIASILFKMKRYKQAQQIYKECLINQQKILGTDHPQYLLTKQNLAATQAKLNNSQSQM